MCMVLCYARPGGPKGSCIRFPAGCSDFVLRGLPSEDYDESRLSFLLCLLATGAPCLPRHVPGLARHGNTLRGGAESRAGFVYQDMPAYCLTYSHFRRGSVQPPGFSIFESWRDELLPT
ncbi:hypothetical protein BDW71DRAFT_182555 [Aspergillus fruticulosus]